ncbi:hypothetical protein GCM10020331_021890 [Ectobacillus funiculus]
MILRWNYGLRRSKQRTLELQRKLSALYIQSKQSFKKLDMVETEEFGNMLILDGMVMTTQKDEFVYHEMVAHVPLFTHPNPENVLVVGGGDGGVIREVFKAPKRETSDTC